MVNLLPWREKLSEERRRAFCVWLLCAILVAAAIVLAFERRVQVELREQRAGNAMLRQDLAALDASLNQIEQLRQQQQHNAARGAAFRQLQARQPAAIALFEALARATPADVQVDLLERQNGRVLIEGVARSHSAVAEFMRRLGHAEWGFQSPLQPSLQRITAQDIPGSEDALPLHAFALILAAENE